MEFCVIGEECTYKWCIMCFVFYHHALVHERWSIGVLVRRQCADGVVSVCITLLCDRVRRRVTRVSVQHVRALS